MDMTELLTGETPRLSVLSVTRAGKGQDIIRHDQYTYKNLAYNFAHRKIEPLYVTVPPDTNREMVPNSHEGQEFDYILSGVMRMIIGKHEVVLHPGDSVYYDSRTPHAMQAVGDEPVQFLAIRPVRRPGKMGIHARGRKGVWQDAGGSVSTDGFYLPGGF